MTLSFKSFILRIEQFGLENFKLKSVSLMNVPNPRLVFSLQKVIIDLELLEHLGISICANLSNDMQEV